MNSVVEITSRNGELLLKNLTKFE